MTTTISGTTVTFTDGSTWAGANGTVTPDYNTSRTATAYNVGYLAFANTVFSAGGGFTGSGTIAWGLSRSNWASPFFDASGNPAGVYVNTTAAAGDYLGSQNFYIANNQGGLGVTAGTWRGRGQALNTGLYQYLGNFVLLERVA
jgi:hypothetical protein